MLSGSHLYNSLFLAVVALAMSIALFFLVGRAQRSERTCAAALVTQSLAAQCYASQSCVFTLADMREVAEAAATRQNECPLDQHPEASQ